MKSFLGGMTSYLRAQKLARKQGLWPLLFVPGLVGALYFPTILWLVYHRGGPLAGHVREHWVPDFLKIRFLEFLLTFALMVLAVYVGFLLFRNVIMLLYAPVIGFLSECTEERMTGRPVAKEHQSTWQHAARRAVGMSLLSLGLSLACLVVCGLLFLVPVVGQVGVAVCLPLSQMFLAGVGFMDPALERRGFTVGRTYRFAWRNRKRVLGLGCSFVLLEALPMFGWFVAPSLGVVAGTMEAVKLLENEGTTKGGSRFEGTT